MKSVRGRGYGLKWGPGVAVDLDSLAEEARADPFLNLLSHLWPLRSPADVVRP